MIGHGDLRKQLESDLPQVTLLRGPKSVGKSTLAAHLATHHGAITVDVMRVETLDAAGARDVQAFASRAPFGTRKFVLIDLDGASETSLNILLKILEEPPKSLSFILTCSTSTLPTVESRCQIFRMGLLNQQQVEMVLRANGMNEQAAEDAARRSRGTVASALEPPPSDNAKAIMLSALKGLADKDREKLDAALSNWSPDSHILLEQWTMEAVTGRWRKFSLTETFGLALDKDLCRSLLRDLGTRPARPKIQARFALTRAVSRME